MHYELKDYAVFFEVSVCPFVRFEHKNGSFHNEPFCIYISFMLIKYIFRRHFYISEKLLIFITFDIFSSY